MRDAIIEMVREFQEAQKEVEDLDTQIAAGPGTVNQDDHEQALYWRRECIKALRDVKLPPAPPVIPAQAAAPPHVVRLPPDLRAVGLTVPRVDGPPPKSATLAEVLGAAKPQTVQPAGPQLEMRPPQRLRDKIARAGLRMVLRALKLDPSPFEQVRRG